MKRSLLVRWKRFKYYIKYFLIDRDRPICDKDAENASCPFCGAEGWKFLRSRWCGHHFLCQDCHGEFRMIFWHDAASFISYQWIENGKEIKGECIGA